MTLFLKYFIGKTCRNSSLSMFDFHTHIVKDGGVPCLLNIPNNMLSSHGMKVSQTLLQSSNTAFSVGLHPWDVYEDWENMVEVVKKESTQDRVWAIGECGLDKLRGTSFDLQLKAFYAQITIAEEVKKPMVIHCVKAFNELIAIRKEIDQENKRRNRKTMPWVIHGFRGKPDLAKQLMAKGLLLSFGHLYNIETLRQVFTFCRPFFLETDDCHLSVSRIYEQVARHLDVNVAHLETLCDPRQTIFSGSLLR